MAKTSLMVAVGIGVGILAIGMNRPASRTIAANDLREPAYTATPYYFSVRFPSEPEIWCVAAGDTLYVDRNGDRDLRAPEERFPLKAPSRHDVVVPGGGDVLYLEGYPMDIPIRGQSVRMRVDWVARKSGARKIDGVMVEAMGAWGIGGWTYFGLTEASRPSRDRADL